MDWSALVTELTEVHGMSQPQIAAFCGCAQSSISALARGETRDPRYATGEALRELVESRRREAAEKAPAPTVPTQTAAHQAGRGSGDV